MDDIVRRWCDGDSYAMLGKDYHIGKRAVGGQMILALSPEFRLAVGDEWRRVTCWMKGLVEIQRPDLAADKDEFVRRWIDGDTLTLLAADYDTWPQTIQRWIQCELSPEFRTATAREWKRALHKCPAPHRFKKGQPSVGVPFKKGEIRGMGARRYTKKHTVRTHTRKIPGTARVVRHKVIKFQDVIGEGHRNWMPLARYLWQLWHGPVPKGHIVVHKNGDMLDDTRDNLIAIPRKDTFDHARRVRPKPFSYAVASKRCSKTMKLRARIQRAMKEKALAVASE
jgi:hypothetical protein